MLSYCHPISIPRHIVSSQHQERKRTRSMSTVQSLVMDNKREMKCLRRHSGIRSLKITTGLKYFWVWATCKYVLLKKIYVVDLLLYCKFSILIMETGHGFSAMTWWWLMAIFRCSSCVLLAPCFHNIHNFPYQPGSFMTPLSSLLQRAVCICKSVYILGMCMWTYESVDIRLVIFYWLL